MALRISIFFTVAFLLAAVIAAITLVVYAIYDPGRIFGLETTKLTISGSQIVQLGLSTALGIIFKLLYDVLMSWTDYTRKIFPSTRLIVGFFTRGVLIAAIVSPVVLSLIASAVFAIGDDLMRFLFAFQNGFFFQSILSKKMEGNE